MAINDTTGFELPGDHGLVVTADEVPPNIEIGVAGLMIIMHVFNSQ